MSDTGAYSEKLNGYWEEGYHFYIEIRNETMTIRDYRRKVQLVTAISYDAEAVEEGRKTPIQLENNVLSVGAANNPMSWFEEMYWEDGLINAVEGYSFMERKDPYTIKKVEHGPFDHIVIRDEEYVPKLQGVWKQWSGSGSPGDDLVISGNEFKWGLHGGKFHIISYNRPGYDPESVRMVPWDLTEDSFRSCSSFDVYPDKLTTYEIIFDMSVPMSVFARAEDLDRIEIPPAAKGGYNVT